MENIDYKTCKLCGADMKYDGIDEDEPLETYRCTKCWFVQYKALNGYEG